MDQTTHMEEDMEITKLSYYNTPERDDFNTTTKLKNFFREYTEDDNSTDTVSPQGYIMTQSPSVSNKTLRHVDIMDDEPSATFKMDFHVADSPVKDTSPTKSKISGADFLKIMSEGSNMSSKVHIDKQSQIQLILNNIENTENDESVHERFAAKDFMSRLTTESSKNIDEVNQSFNLNDMTKLSAVSIDLDSSVDMTEKILKELNVSIATGVLPKQIPSTGQPEEEENEPDSKTQPMLSHTKGKLLKLQDLFPKRVNSTPSPKSSPVANSQDFRSNKQLDVSDQETPNQSVCKTPEMVDSNDVLPDLDPNSTAQTPSFIETFKEINLAKPKNAAETSIDNFNEMKTDSTPSTQQSVATEKESSPLQVERAELLDLSKRNLSVKILQDLKDVKPTPMAAQSLQSYADYCETFGTTQSASAAKKVNLGEESPIKDNQKSNVQVTPTKKNSQLTDPQDFDHTQASTLPQIITVTPRRALPVQKQDVQAMKPTDSKTSILSFQESSESAFASVPLSRNKILSDAEDVNSKTDVVLSPNVTSSKQESAFASVPMSRNKILSDTENVNNKTDVVLSQNVTSTTQKQYEEERSLAKLQTEKSPERDKSIIRKSPIIKETSHFEVKSPVVPLPKNALMKKSLTARSENKAPTVNKSLLMNTLPGKSPEAAVLDSSPEQIVLDSPQQSKMQTEDNEDCLLYTSPSPRDKRQSRMPSSA